MQMRTRKFLKRALVVLTALFILIGVLPFAAFAEDAEVPVESALAEPSSIAEESIPAETSGEVSSAPEEAGSTVENPTNRTEDPSKAQEALTLSAPMADGTVIHVDGVLPVGTTLQAVPVASPDIENVLNDKVAEEGRSLAGYMAYDITLHDADGNEIQPEGDVRLTLSNPAFSPALESEDIAMCYVDDAATMAEVVAVGTDTATVEHFTIYAIYKVNGFEVTFRVDDGADAGNETVEVKSGDVCPEPVTPPSAPANYRFKEWVDKDGIPFDFNTTITENLTLWARFVLDTTTPITSWNALRNAIEAAPSNTLCEIVVGNINDYTTQIDIKSDRNIRLVSKNGTEDEATLDAKASGRHFSVQGGTLTIGSGVTLTGGRGGTPNYPGNQDMLEGSAVYVYQGHSTLILDGGKISGNSVGNAYAPKSAVFSASGGTIIMNAGSVISGNRARGVRIYGGGTFTMNGGTISGQLFSPRTEGVSYEVGYGVEVFSGTFTMHGGTISGNEGPGVFVQSYGNFTMEGGTISNNSAITPEYSSDNYRGGGVFLWYSSKFTMNGGTITGNTADEGGGVYSLDANFTMNGGSITNNEAKKNGGGVFHYGSNTYTTITNGTIADNTAEKDGGGIGVSYSNLARVKVGAPVVFSGNTSQQAYPTLHPDDQATYNTNILGTQWSSTHTQGYNNDDIAYTRMPPDYSITFHANGGRFAGGETTTLPNKATGAQVTVAEVESIGKPSRDGATFIGWATNNGNSANDAVTFPYTVGTSNLVFYAIWEVNYTVRHVDRDTNTLLLEQTGLYAPAGSAANPAYLDVGTLLPALYRTDGKAGHTTALTFTDSPEVHVVTCYYVRQFTVTLNANGGSFGTGATRFTVDRNGTVQESQMPAVSHANEQFEQWVVQSGPGEGSPAFGQAAQYTVTDNAVLMATWAGFQSYTVYHVNRDDNSIIKREPYNVAVGTTVTHSPNPQTAQYTPVSSAVVSKTIRKAGAGVDNDITFYYDVRSYTVTFWDNLSNSTVAAQNVKYGARASAVASPSHNGYTFTGWHKNSSGTVPWDFASDTVSSNITLYAGWQPVSSSSSTPPSSSSSETPVTPPPVAPSSSSTPPTASSSSSSTPTASSSSGGNVAPAEPAGGTTPPDAGPTGGGGNGETTTTLTPQDQQRIEAQEGRGIFENILNGNVPLAGFDFTGAWSLLSLMLAVFSFAVCLLNTIRWLARPHKGRYTGEGDLIVSKRHETALAVIRGLAVSSGLLVGVAFLILDNMSLPIVLINANTPIIIFMALMQPVLLLLSMLITRSRNKAEQTIQEEDDKVVRE